MRFDRGERNHLGADFAKRFTRPVMVEAIGVRRSPESPVSNHPSGGACIAFGASALRSPFMTFGPSHVKQSAFGEAGNRFEARFDAWQERAHRARPVRPGLIDGDDGRAFRGAITFQHNGSEFLGVSRSSSSRTRSAPSTAYFRLDISSARAARAYCEAKVSVETRMLARVACTSLGICS